MRPLAKQYYNDCVDRDCCLQLYRALISRFYEQTGVPILLNTSLNENEPIVRTPVEAISCFLRTDMDALVLGPHLIDRRRKGFAAEYRKRVGA